MTTPELIALRHLFRPDTRVLVSGYESDIDDIANVRAKHVPTDGNAKPQVMSLTNEAMISHEVGLPACGR